MKKTTKSKSTSRVVHYNTNVEPTQTTQNRDFRTIVLVVLLIILSFTSGYFWNRVKTLEKNQANVPLTNAPQQPPTRPTEIKIERPSDKDQWRGDKKARFVWVEYSDFECPFCKRIHPDLIKIMSEYSGKLSWVYRHFPLEFHPKAKKTAEAVECANELGGIESFWSMNDAIFKEMPDMELTELSTIASNIGLDATAFQTCLDSNKYADQVKSESEEGQKAGIQATPTGVLYDMKTGKTQLVEGAVPYDSLKTTIENFIKQQEG